MAVVEEGRFSWQGILLPPLFSVVGFPVFLLLAYGDPSSNGSVVFGAVVGWLYYLLLTAWSLCTKRRKIFIRVFVVLCISLLLNVAGCESMKHSNWKTEIQPPTKTRYLVSHNGN